ncbi:MULTISPECIES: UDP-glucose 4-epimerase GalE [unclassified Rathayibacter]|uniref:UDP-glucose 4-epimerase GalE n=1 Tax=unclassified Rathayibacter TaxID=2609250 RepID=UPI0006F58146|nr:MULTISPECIES: UDP-glucose 4-epimerase GalE [unclassified Rathayibacter]KQQ05656.1 UDP-glucose 4-epimerase [Rathayibacter sp. Leaf294]KQS13515.1 UDP-glucose 4-epimerase [Rathayibacter sp. Leaf185]
MRVLLVGGAGYIGSHTAVALVDSGHEVLIVDDLSHAGTASLSAVENLTGVRLPLLVADARDEARLTRFVREHAPVDAVVLLAGLKSVGESVARPLEYYAVNLGAAMTTFAVAAATGIRTIVFSSSATVYRPGGAMPVAEDAPTGLDLANPYGRTKRVIEEILADVSRADPALTAVSLRYFNPVGAHPSGLIGEDPAGLPTNLMPIVSRAAADPELSVDVFGDDYDTPDGTGLRDYIHVSDLAAGHVAALERAATGHSVYNLGTGVPTSVLELIDAFEEESGTSIRRRLVGRRPGDVAASYADPRRAAQELGWRATRTIRDCVRDQWRWQTSGMVHAV